jgi:hypothetical protein
MPNERDEENEAGQDEQRQDTTIHLNAAMLAAYDSGALAGLLSDYHRHELRRYLFPVLPLFIVATLTLGRKKRTPRGERPLCGARTRKGTRCASRVVKGQERCRLHGGLSTGPKTAEGRARIAQSNRRRAQ